MQTRYLSCSKDLTTMNQKYKLLLVFDRKISLTEDTMMVKKSGNLLKMKILIPEAVLMDDCGDMLIQVSKLKYFLSSIAIPTFLENVKILSSLRIHVNLVL